MNKEIIVATLSLFNGIIVSKNSYDDKILSRYLKSKQYKWALNRGFVLSPSIYCEYKNDVPTSLLNQINESVGIDGANLNSSFHKSWEKVRDTPMEQLVIEQITHYFTTYSFEALGIDNSGLVYIPLEKLKIPKINIEKIPVILIRGYTIDEIKEKISKLLSSGIALSAETIQHITLLIKNYKLFTASDITNVKNKEMRVVLYKELNIIPSDNIEFLRFLVYIITGNSLLIKNKETIQAIKDDYYLPEVHEYFKEYCYYYGIPKLGEIFYRFKPLFLAFKTHTGCSTIINDIRRAAKHSHKSLKEDYLNSVTQLLAKDRLDLRKLLDELKKVNIFRKIKLLYALNTRLMDCSSAVYNIRNGKTWTKILPVIDYNYEHLSNVYNEVYSNIVDDVLPNVKGKRIYIPKNITYAIPSTEKQFVDKIPAGTNVEFHTNVVFGVHWTNNENRVDLDLSLLLPTQKIGWDGYFRSGGDILFSGDMTDAPLPNGAAELFSIDKNNQKQFLVSLNYFNLEEKTTNLPFKLFLAKSFDSKMGKNYMVDPNNIIVQCNLELKRQQKIIGFIDNNKFYFVNGDFIQNRTSRANKHTLNAMEYFTKFYQKAPSLNILLRQAGAILVDNPEDCDIDLSLQNLEKDTIINLLIKQ